MIDIQAFAVIYSNKEGQQIARDVVNSYNQAIRIAKYYASCEGKVEILPLEPVQIHK